jgi:hypothetical protein
MNPPGINNMFDYRGGLQTNVIVVDISGVVNKSVGVLFDGHGLSKSYREGLTAQTHINNRMRIGVRHIQSCHNIGWFVKDYVPTDKIVRTKNLRTV